MFASVQPSFYFAVTNQQHLTIKIEFVCSKSANRSVSRHIHLLTRFSMWAKNQDSINDCVYCTTAA